MIQANTAPLPVRLDGLRVAITAGAGGIGRVLADGFAVAADGLHDGFAAGGVSVADV